MGGGFIARCGCRDREAGVCHSSLSVGWASTTANSNIIAVSTVTIWRVTSIAVPGSKWQRHRGRRRKCLLNAHAWWGCILMRQHSSAWTDTQNNNPALTCLEWRGGVRLNHRAGGGWLPWHWTPRQNHDMLLHMLASCRPHPSCHCHTQPNSLLPSKPIHTPHLPSLVAELRAPLLLPTAVSSDRPHVDSSSRPAAPTPPPAPPAPAARTAVAGVNSGQQNMDAERQLPLPHRWLLFFHPLLQLVQPILSCCCCCCCSRHHLCPPPRPRPRPHIPINNAGALYPTPEGCRSPPLQAVLLPEPAAAPAAAAAPRLGDFNATLPAPPAAAAVMRLCWPLCLSGLVWSNLSRSCKLSSVPGSSSS